MIFIHFNNMSPIGWDQDVDGCRYKLFQRHMNSPNHGHGVGLGHARMHLDIYQPPAQLRYDVLRIQTLPIKRILNGIIIILKCITII